MAETDLLRRLLEAGATFTDMTRARAESIVEDLVRAGEVGVDQAQTSAQELVDRSRQNTERLVTLVRGEIANQLAVATEQDVARLDARVTALEAAARRAPATRSGARKSTAKKSTAKKSTARKSTARKSTAKKSTARKSTAKKSAPAKKRAAAKKAPAKKSGAKRATKKQATTAKKAAT